MLQSSRQLCGPQYCGWATRLGAEQLGGRGGHIIGQAIGQATGQVISQAIEATSEQQIGNPLSHLYKCDLMAITKAKLGDSLFNDIGLNKREARELIELFFECIQQKLEAGTSVKLPGFGSFMVRKKSARPGRNLQTGELMSIPARRVVVFRASQKLRNQMADNSQQLTEKLQHHS